MADPSPSTSPTTSISLLPSSTMSITPTTTTDLTPVPSMSQGGGNSDSGGGGGNLNNNGPSLASSASLYLYTFLATLVLLLSVSAAIVIRSFLLRRRHRRMIEEAIRNGTWVPPAPSGRGAPRVDLSKKPKMWEAYLDLHHQQQQQQHMVVSMSDERDWESMKPVMATYINDSAAKKSPTNLSGGGAARTGAVVPAAGGGTNTGGGQNEDDTGGDQVSNGRRLVQRMTHRVRRALSTTPSIPQLPTTNSGNGNNTRPGSTANLVEQGDAVPMTELTASTPSKVRVAVLIAMPRPHTSSTSTSAFSSTSSGSPSTSRSTSTSSTPQIPLAAPTATHNPALDEEDELPHIEVGVAELVVMNSSPSASMDGARSSLSHGPHDAKGKVRESMMSVGSV